MKLITCLFLPLLTIAGYGQQLLILPENEPDALVWNEKFMARNGITEIKGKLSVKREGEPIHPKPEKYLFRFDTLGRTIYRNTSYGRPGNGKDTTWIRYGFDEDGSLRHTIRADIGGFYEYANEYDENQRLQRQTYSRVSNRNADRYDFEPGDRTEIYDEHYRYKSPDTDLMIKTYLNDQQLPYREDQYQYNDDGYLVQIESMLLISRKRSLEQFTYDSKGRLNQRIIHGATGKPTIRHVYVYDSTGQLSKHETWTDHEFTTTDEFLYHGKTGLLSARLTKDMRTGVIRIIKFSYDQEG
jgi:hypothetical protein